VRLQREEKTLKKPRGGRPPAVLAVGVEPEREAGLELGGQEAGTLSGVADGQGPGNTEAPQRLESHQKNATIIPGSSQSLPKPIPAGPFQKTLPWQLGPGAATEVGVTAPLA
jgi:hypothetical protein